MYFTNDIVHIFHRCSSMTNIVHIHMTNIVHILHSSYMTNILRIVHIVQKSSI